MTETPPQPIGLQKRAVQIMTGNVCVTIASDTDDLDRVKQLAIELADKYMDKDEKKECQ